MSKQRKDRRREREDDPTEQLAEIRRRYRMPIQKPDERGRSRRPNVSIED